MFDISALKEMKLSELQEIAKLAKTIKTTGVKKDALIALILAEQGNNAPPKAAEKPAKAVAEDKPKISAVSSVVNPVKYFNSTTRNARSSFSPSFSSAAFSESNPSMS